MKKNILFILFVLLVSFLGYSQDSDGDGISDANEIILGTDPFDDDTDDDGLLDGFEDANQNGIIEATELNPTRFDTDGDGLSDGLELGLTSPQGVNTDLGIFVADADPAATTDPFNDDTDDDGLLDGFEDANQNGMVDSVETDPLNPDTDSDFLGDGLELGLASPQGVNTASFVADADAGATTTDPLNPDTDFGGVIDGDEDLNKNGVVDSGETDPNNGADDGTLSLIINDFRKRIKISKNPFPDNINILLGQQYEFIKVTVSNILGQTIKSFTEKSVRNLNFEVSNESGIFFINLSTSQGDRAILKVIKE